MLSAQNELSAALSTTAAQQPLQKSATAWRRRRQCPQLLQRRGVTALTTHLQALPTARLCRICSAQQAGLPAGAQRAALML
jgi:hypothetical protein